MRERSWFGAILALALATPLVACAGRSVDDDAPPPQTPPSPLEKLTVAVYPGLPPSPGSDCPENYPSTQVVVASSHELSWDYCGQDTDSTHEMVLQGSRTLTDAEFKTVTAALGKVQVTHGNNCGFDGNVITLDVQNEDGVELYADDFYAGCPWAPEQEGRTFASGLDDLAEVTGALALQK